MKTTASQDYELDIVEILHDVVDPPARPVIFLEAGHFKPAEGADEFSITSLRSALRLAEVLISTFGRDLRLVFGVLMDDLRERIDDDAENSLALAVPGELHDLIQQHRLARSDRLLVSTERNARNRALSKLKKLCRDEIDNRLGAVEESDATRIVLKGDLANDVTLAYRKAHGAIAHCPAIMGQHYADSLLSLKKRFPLSEQLLVLDWSEMFDFSKVTGGARACRELFMDERLNDTECHVINLFFGDARGDIYRLHHDEPAPA